MDSKGVHRVADSMQLKATFDAKIKIWRVGDKTWTSAEVEKMSSLDMRKALTPPGQTLVMRGKQMVAESKDAGGDASKDDPGVGKFTSLEKGLSTAIGHPPVAVEGAEKSDVAKAAELMQKTGGSVTAALQEHVEQVAAGKDVTKMAKKKAAKKAKGNGAAATKRTPPVREAGVVKIDGNPATKPKRVGEDKKGMLWLKQFGIHKWALRNKAKQHGAPADVVKLLAKPTQWYGSADLKNIVKHAIFTPQDKALLAKPEAHTAYAVKCAKAARDIAEKVLAAL